MRDIFPARVMTPAKTYPKARVLIEGDRTRVYVAEGQTVKLVHNVTGQVTDSGSRVEVTVNGETWFVRSEAGGCGCKRKGPLRTASRESLWAMTLESA